MAARFRLNRENRGLSYDLHEPVALIDAGENVARSLRRYRRQRAEAGKLPL